MNDKVCIVNGTSRKNGNTSFVLNKVINFLKENDKEVDVNFLIEQKIKFFGCRGCRKCKREKNFTCAIDDDITEIIGKIKESDFLFLATPVYMGGPTAYTKAFIDRLYSLYWYNDNKRIVDERIKDLKVCLILTSGAAYNLGIQQTFEQVSEVFSDLKKDVKLLYVENCTSNPQDMTRREGLSDEVREFLEMNVV